MEHRVLIFQESMQREIKVHQAQLPLQQTLLLLMNQLIHHVEWFLSLMRPVIDCPRQDQILLLILIRVC